MAELNEQFQKAWEGFAAGEWQTSVNTRDFIQKNYTPYEGDESFLAGATEATTKLWDKVMEGIKIENRAREPRTYRIELRDAGATRIISPRAEYRLEPGGRVVAPLFVISPRDGFTRGERAAQAVVSDDAGWSTTLAVTVLGPEGTP